MGEAPPEFVREPLDLGEAPPIMHGALHIHPATRTVHCNGKSIVMQPRVMQVLVALVEANGEVVSRDRLIARCWNGRVVGDDALNRCIVILRTLARDLGDCFEVENIPRVGYRIAIRETTPSPAIGTRNSVRRRAALIILAIVASGAGVGAAWWNSERPEKNATADAAEEGASRGRALMRTGNPQVASDARMQFELALKRDPSLVEAWVGLAMAIRAEASLQGPEQIIAVMPSVRANLRRALELSPTSPGAHIALAGLEMPGSPAFRRHLAIAAQSNPESAEAQIGLADKLRADGDFAGELAAYRRAAQLDPDWYRPVRDLAIATAEMGDRAGALAIGRSVKLPTKGCSGPQARIAWIYGDIAEAARCSIPNLSVDSIWREPDRVRFESGRLALGLISEGSAAAPLHIVDYRPPQGRVWMAAAPSPAEWRSRNRGPDASLAWRFENFVGAKMMLNSGRANELAATYDGPTGLLGIHRAGPLLAANLPAVPIVAIALEKVGRKTEADALLDAALAMVDRIRARGPVPFTFDRDAAGVAAAAGRTDRAIADLRQARERGWVNDDWGDLLQLRDEPALANLRGHPSFEAIAVGLDRLYARERREFIAWGLEAKANAANR